MPRFVDWSMSDEMIEALWTPGADGKTRSPLDAINDRSWTDDWMPGNDEDLGNPDIAEIEHENSDPHSRPSHSD